VSGFIERERHACDAESFFSAPDNGIVEPKRASRRSAERLQIGKRCDAQFSPGIWTCAALYVALGLIGIPLLTGEPSIATSSEGYGIAATASPTPLR
jgi:hypothetical protein